MRDELAELLADPKSVVAVEWAQIIEDVLPAQRLTVRIKATGEKSRSLEFTYPEQLKHLLPANT